MPDDLDPEEYVLAFEEAARKELLAVLDQHPRIAPELLGVFRKGYVNGAEYDSCPLGHANRAIRLQNTPGIVHSGFIAQDVRNHRVRVMGSAEKRSEVGDYEPYLTPLEEFAYPIDSRFLEDDENADDITRRLELLAGWVESWADAHAAQEESPHEV